jgi:hypothetical protein
MLLDALKTVRHFPPALPVQGAAVLPARKNQHSARVHEQRRKMTWKRGLKMQFAIECVATKLG